jgi:phosphohistidine phosphatase SixA
MTANRILVMRHAEKPGDPMDPDLSDAGKRRAELLAAYIPQQFGRPDFLFAPALSKHSARPIQTLTPLSKAIGVPIDATTADQDYRALAQDLTSQPQYSGKLALVCWHHGNIPSLMIALGAPPRSFPDPWDPTVFNLILQADFAASAAPKVMQVIEPF